MSIYLKIDSIVGESTDAGFVGKSNVIGCFYGFGRRHAPDTDLPTGPILPNLVEIQKPFDSSSIAIGSAAGTGFLFKQAVVQFTTILNGTRLESVRLLLKNVRVERYALSNNRGGGVALDDIALSYLSMSVRFTHRDIAGRILSTETYDIVAG